MFDRDPLGVKFQPLVGHWEDDICITRDGSLMAMRHLQGFSADLSSPQQILNFHYQDNFLMRAVADRRVEIWEHFVRQDKQSIPPFPQIDLWYPSRFDDAYHAAQGSKTLFRNDHFITILMTPEPDVRSAFKQFFLRREKDALAVSRPVMLAFQSLLQRLDAGLEGRYGSRKLSLEMRDGVPFSEIAEAQHVIMNAKYRPIGNSPMRLGRLLTPNRIIFGKDAFEICRPGGSLFGAMISFHDYPAWTRPGMMRDIHRVEHPLVMTSACRFLPQQASLNIIRKQRKRMQAGEDAALSQMAELQADEDAIQSGESVYLRHHHTVAVYGSSMEELDYRVGEVEAKLSTIGVTPEREREAVMPTYFSQAPGNMQWAPRPGYVKSINAVGFTAKHDVPRGRYRGRWGAPLMALRTTENTHYYLHFHVQDAPQIPAEDLGNILVLGGSGSGKTSLIASMGMLSLRNPDARVVVIDKDYGQSVMVRACGGPYFVFRSGEPSGLQPLQALRNSTRDVTHLLNLYKGCAEADGRRGLTNDEVTELRQSIEAQMMKPVERRSLGGVVAPLRASDADGVGRRLKIWCRGEPYGWVLDCERDELRMDQRIVGFETGELFQDPIAASPTLGHLFYRVRQLIDGRPIVLMIDEMWQADRIESFREENNNNLKTIRKREGVVVMATQSAADALKSPIAHTFKQQVPTKIVFGDASATREELVDGLGFTEAQYLAVTRQLPTMRHTFLIQRPSGSALCRFDLSSLREKVAVVSARDSTFRLMEELIERYGPAPQDWVPHFERLAPDVARAETKQSAGVEP